MAEFVVSASMGVMNPLLAKLSVLMGDEYKKLKGLLLEVSFLKSELNDMKALLEKMDSADQLDPQAKNWRKDIIDMTYDIEDYMDDFMHHVDEANDKVGILQKASHMLRTIKDRYRIANQIQEIKARVLQASERRKRYKVDESICSPMTSISIDPRLSAIYKESTSLVGINKQKEDLIKWVLDEGQQLKVTSIVGFGGLGKTTLANEVYREVESHFNCNIFMSISHKPDIARLLSGVISKLKLQLPSSHSCEVIDFINTLVEYLQDKRYFIIVDDLWGMRAWNIISCAFPRNDKMSRVIVTTRIEDVAKACCGDNGSIHIMKPLSDSDSRKLFFNRIFGSEDACPSHFINVSCEILKKCGGLPLAIISIASILACQPTRIKEQWEYIKNSLAPHSGSNTTLEDMMHILDLSYKHLPQHLKACFLYLGLYPEDQEICKDELARRWVAEGFVSNSHGQDAWKDATSYFNDLINRSMIQPVYDRHIFEVTRCRVHDFMLDLIIRRGREDNFVFVVNDHQDALMKVKDQKVRRLSIDFNGADDDRIMQVKSTSCLSQVRCLTIHGASKWLPPSEFKFLRVLFFGLAKRVERIDLTGITHLTQLRYLKVECKLWSQDGPELCILLPTRQIQRLRYLETLEMPDTSVCTFPKCIFELPRLSHIILPDGTRLPDGIGNLKSLRTLDRYSLRKNSSENIEALGELTNLSYLNISCQKFYWETTLKCTDDDDTPEEIWMPALRCSLGKLGNLKELSLISLFQAFNGDALSLLSPPFDNLEKFDLYSWNFSRLPRWMSDLNHLRYLCLGLMLKETTKSMSTCWEEDVGIIGKLPSLVLLWLRMPITLMERIAISCYMGFKVLEQFLIDCDGISYLTFETGAMPRLWKLSLGVDPEQWDKEKAMPGGLQHLSNLKEIFVLEADSTGPRARKHNTSTMELIKGVFQEAAAVLPSCPAITSGLILSRKKGLPRLLGILDGCNSRAPAAP